MHVGQPVMTALEPKRQPGMLDAQAVQHRGVQIVDVNGIVA